MFKVQFFRILISHLFFSKVILCLSSLGAKPYCPTRCGNLTIPYPFGTDLEGACSLSEYYIITCNSTFYDPPKAFLGTGNLEVVDISVTGQVRIKTDVATTYFHGGKIKGYTGYTIHLNNYPYVFSDTKNKFTLIGCDDYAYIYGTLGQTFKTGCIVGCSNQKDVINGSCSGIGCCQTSIPKGLRNFEIYAYSFNNHTNVSYFNPYNFAFLAEQNTFTFNVADLNDSTFKNWTQEHIPVLLEWFVGVNQTCNQAKRNLSSYVCQKNTSCTDFYAGSTKGYRCNCLPGYEGNPYHSLGCTDIDECATNSSNICSDVCINIPGSYTCSCPKGHQGDGLKNGKGCISNSSQFLMRLSLGLSLGFLSSVMLMGWI